MENFIKNGLQRWKIQSLTLNVSRGSFFRGVGLFFSLHSFLLRAIGISTIHEEFFVMSLSGSKFTIFANRARGEKWDCKPFCFVPSPRSPRQVSSPSVQIRLSKDGAREGTQGLPLRVGLSRKCAWRVPRSGLSIHAGATPRPRPGAAATRSSFNVAGVGTGKLRKWQQQVDKT